MLFQIPVIPPPLPVPPAGEGLIDMSPFWDITNINQMIGALQSIFILATQNYVLIAALAIFTIAATFHYLVAFMNRTDQNQNNV